MTQEPVATIAYAGLHDDQATVARWLRRVVAWTAIAYGGGGCVAKLFFVAVSGQWLDSAADFGDFTIAQTILALVEAAGYAAVFAAGMMILWRMRTVIFTLRAGAALALVGMFGEQAYNASWGLDELMFRALNLAHLPSQAALPGLFIAMTLGPPGRMLRRE